MLRTFAAGLIVLAALSALGGLMLLNDWIVDFLAPVTGTAEHVEPPIPAWSVSVLVLVVVAVGATIARNLTSFDQHGVDGVVEGGSRGIGGVGMLLRRTQNGYVRSYALSLLGGALLVILALLAVNFS